MEMHSVNLTPTPLSLFLSGEVKEGVLLFDKPKGWTSFDVIRKLRRLIGVKKIGHAGTLDPMATGLLICCVGRRYTREIAYFQNLRKRYEATIRLGATTPCYDAMMPPENHKDWKGVTPQHLESARQQFVGEILQRPPIYSAIKQGGRRAYARARAGEKVVLPPRQVCIDSFDFTAINLPDIACTVVCSKGTYIRSLAHDIGQFLDTGGYLTALKRVSIGAYSLEFSDYLPLDR